MSTIVDLFLLIQGLKTLDHCGVRFLIFLLSYWISGILVKLWVMVFVRIKIYIYLSPLVLYILLVITTIFYLLPSKVICELLEYNILVSIILVRLSISRNNRRLIEFVESCLLELILALVMITFKDDRGGMATCIHLVVQGCSHMHICVFHQYYVEYCALLFHMILDFKVHLSIVSSIDNYKRKVMWITNFKYAFSTSLL